MNQAPLLSVKNLSLGFKSRKTTNAVLHDISFDVLPNEIVGIVGESGSGKSVTNLAVLGLLPQKSVDISSGEILFEGADLLNYSTQELQEIRGNAISMIFQEPMSSLNPSMRCGKQVTEILQRHKKLSAQEAKTETLNLFEQVKLPRPASVFC